PYFSMLEIRNQLLPSKPGEQVPTERSFGLAPGERYDAVFIDGCKSWFGTKVFMREMANHVMPGTYFLFQDYAWITCYWLPVFLLLFQDKLELCAHYDTTYVFRLHTPYSAAQVDSRFPDSVAECGRDGLTECFNHILRDAYQRADTLHLTYCSLQFAMGLGDLGAVPDALAHIDGLRYQTFAQPYLHRLDLAEKLLKERLA
ncbi:MAG: hypothetical protein KDD69_20120, partial [Bdellovibrionales bacterium]|nr:hypothetical protein [Bdellovibrionales bacterium]